MPAAAACWRAPVETMTPTQIVKPYDLAAHPISRSVWTSDDLSRTVGEDVYSAARARWKTLRL